MRKLVAVVLLVAVAPTVVLGAMFLLSSRFKAISAEIESQDLASVASDLASPEELAKERAAANKRRDVKGTGTGGRQLGLAIGLLAVGVGALLGGILAFTRRGHRLVSGLAFAGLAVLIATVVLEGYNLLGAAAGLLFLIAAVASLPSSDWRRAEGSRAEG